MRISDCPKARTARSGPGRCQPHGAAIGPLRKLLLAVTLAMALVAAGHQASAVEPKILVFAAASTTNALEEVSRVFSAQSHIAVLHSFASSSTLARQIVHGAPADVYLSANIMWMDYLEKRGLLEPGSRRSLLTNRLVLIAPTASRMQSVTIDREVDLAALLNGGRLAMGDPAHVPAGIYAKQALTSLGLWRKLARRVAAAPSVRSALVLVERGEAPLGVVYATDAAISDRVKTVGVFPSETHQPIVYPAAIIAGQGSRAARAYLRFLGSPRAVEIFTAHGFLAQ